MNTIGDMQNEKDLYGHCNEFEYNHDFEKFLWKIDDALKVNDVLDGYNKLNLCLQVEKL